MERQIPHVLDVFSSSPGERRRQQRANLLQKEKEEFQKNPGSDSAVSVGSSDEETEEQRNIARYFEYLNEDEASGGGSSQRRKKKKKIGKESVEKKNKVTGNERESRKDEFEKEGIKHIERHLSMKKTIRKKMMRDLQQAFVEDPKDLQQDPKALPEEKKANIDISNLTLSKKRISKSEHNFLDMLKDDEVKEKKSGFKALIDFRKDRTANVKAERREGWGEQSKAHTPQKEEGDRDDDSGHGSPSREYTRSRSKDCYLDRSSKDIDKKPGFWKRITGKNKSKR